MSSTKFLNLIPAVHTGKLPRKGSLVDAVARVQWLSTDRVTATNEVEVVKTKRSRRRFRRIEEVPSYRDFLHRQTVLALYRQFLRTVRPLSDRDELQQQIKKEFAAMKNEADSWNRKRAVNEGQRRLKDLQATVSTSVTFGSDSPQQLGEGGTDSDSKVGSGWPWERN